MAAAIGLLAAGLLSLACSDAPMGVGTGLGETPELKRGLVEVAVTIDDRRYYFVSTHLEPDIAGIDWSGLRAAQAWELAVA